MIKFKSVADKKEKGDGLRILAARFRGHGLTKDKYDVWMANLAPSEKILKPYVAGKLSWEKFAKEYEKEMQSSAAEDKKNKTILNHGQKFTLRLLKELGRHHNVTLMCHCATASKTCHLRVLSRLLKST